MANQTIAQRYILQGELGVGGMGTVYKGLDTHNNQVVAIKHLKPEVADAALVERFKREGEALRDLNHPNIVKMLDAVEEDGQHYLVMDYVSGGDLKSLIVEHGQLSFKQAVNIAIDLSDALTRAHRLNIIHRDLKPANVLIAEDGTVRLTDFGIAHLAEKERVTQTDALVGTVDYLSPESLNGQSADTRSDIWAFGILMFEMLTGQRPFEGKSVGEIIASILTKPLPDLEELRPEIPIALADLVYRMLEKDSQMRIASVRYVGAELESILLGNGVDSHSTAAQSQIQVSRFEDTTPTTIPTKHNLPTPPTAFVGRESELDALDNFLGDNKTRLVTILGMGGLGKTRLALETAHRYTMHDTRLQIFTHGIYFVPLAPIDSADLVLTTIVESIGFTFYSTDNLKQQLMDYLREKSMLLVLDNFEHVISAASIVADILAYAPKVKVIVTSRERLNLQGETIFTIGGMEFPDYETPEDLLDYSGVKLFLQSANRVQPGFELTTENLPYLVRICRLVQGVPLGIELAAAWVDALRLDEISVEIESNLDFLETEMRDTPERHRSIRAVFEYSWNLLADSERDLLIKLSVFRGGFTRDAAIAIANTSLRTLTTLVNKSLLSRDMSGRYHVHELIRQYAEGNLKASGFAAEIAESHARYYADYSSNILTNYTMMSDSNKIQLLELEIDNVRLAWHWAIQTKDVPAVTLLNVPLHGFYQARSLFSESRDMAQIALKVFDNAEQTEATISMLIDLLITLGWMSIRLGEIDTAITALERGTDLIPMTDFPIGHEDPMSALGLAHSILGNYDLGIKYAMDGLNYNLSRNDDMSAMVSYYCLTSAAIGQGNYQEAKQYSLQALEKAEMLKLTWFETYIHIDLGHIARAMKDYEQAIFHYHKCYTIRRESFKDPEGMAVSLKFLGLVSYLQGDAQQARSQFEESLKIYEDIGDRVGLTTALTGLGKTLVALKDFQSAWRQHHRALQLSHQLQVTSVTLSTLVGWGDLLLQTNQPEWGHEVLGFVLNHEISSQENKDDVNSILEQHGDLNHPALAKSDTLTVESVTQKLLKTSADDFSVK